MTVLDHLRPDNFARANESHTRVECSCAGLKPGQAYTTAQLVAAILMVSGNDAANMLADMLGGQQVAVAAMNRKAALVGARGTRASSPSGLDGPGWESVTTPHDLAVIMRAALKYPLIAQIMRSPSAPFPGKTLHNQNELLTRYPGNLARQDRFHQSGPQDLRRGRAARQPAAGRGADVRHRRSLRPGDPAAGLRVQPTLGPRWDSLGDEVAEIGPENRHAVTQLVDDPAKDHQRRIGQHCGARTRILGVAHQIRGCAVGQTWSA